MLAEIQKLIDNYFYWLKERTTIRQIDDWVEITTPYLDRHNDYTHIYAKNEKGGFILTDNGYTIQDLKLSGCDLDSKRRKMLLETTLNGFGVKRNNDTLLINATLQNFSLQKHNIIQAILAVNDLFYLASPMVANLFLEDVTSWLDSYDIRYTPNLKFTGKSGYDHKFDFIIPKSRVQPERIIRVINHPNRDAVTGMIYSWIDTKNVRPVDSKAYAFLNDTQNQTLTKAVEALRSVEVKSVLWSKRNLIRDELAA
ncbi:MAG: DUF1829 domain-containing protein [Candidatus Omnitrophota bacterium]